MANEKSGLPDKLKAGIEALSGMRMDDVQVHYNSPEPARHNAHAYTQGSVIHLGPGREHHLAHEAWHVVQQAQGRVSAMAHSRVGLTTDEEALRVERDLLARRTPL